MLENISLKGGENIELIALLDGVVGFRPKVQWAKVISKCTCADLGLFLGHHKYNSHLKTKIASPSDEGSI